jgi:hypothetical protein
MPARKTTPRQKKHATNGQSPLETAVLNLILNQALFNQQLAQSQAEFNRNQALFNQQLAEARAEFNQQRAQAQAEFNQQLAQARAEFNHNQALFNQQLAQTNAEIARTHADLWELERANTERFARIEQLLIKHELILQEMPETIRQKIGFQNQG